MTPAEHRAEAEAIWASVKDKDPSTAYYGHKIQAAIFHVWAAVAAYLEPPGTDPQP